MSMSSAWSIKKLYNIRRCFSSEFSNFLLIHCSVLKSVSYFCPRFFRCDYFAWNVALYFWLICRFLLISVVWQYFMKTWSAVRALWLRPEMSFFFGRFTFIFSNFSGFKCTSYIIKSSIWRYCDRYTPLTKRLSWTVNWFSRFLFIAEYLNVSLSGAPFCWPSPKDYRNLVPTSALWYTLSSSEFLSL